MTTTTNPYVQYTATSSQTVFIFNWEFYNSTEIVVYYTLAGNEGNDATNLLAPSFYAVSSASPFGGTITLNTPAAAGDIVTITRVMALTSVATFNDGYFTPEQLNQSFDNVIYMVQGLSYNLFHNAPTYNNSTNNPPIITTADTILPQLAANQIWVMNSTRTAIVAVEVPNGVFGAGTVTQVNTGPGLTGGPITEVGTIQVATAGITTAMMATNSPHRIAGWDVGGNFTPIITGSGLTYSDSPPTLSVSAGGIGTVTSVATGTGLTGGPITGAGTISIAASTANSLAGYNSSGTFADVTVGSGLALSGGTLTASGGGGGAMVQISQVIASNQASVQFTSISNTFNYMVLNIAQLLPVSTANAFTMQCSQNNGPPFLTSGLYDVVFINNGTLTPSVGSNLASFKLSDGNYSNSSSFFGFYNIRFQERSFGFNYIAEGNYYNGTNQVYYNSTGQVVNPPINTLLFSFASGNIASGIFTLYGIT